MKKILLSLLLFVSIGAIAGEKKDDSKYLAGAVPEENGIITFKKSFSVPEKTDAEVRRIMHNFVNQLVENSIPAPGNYARLMEENQDSLVARVCEWLVFKKKPLLSDKTRFRFQIKINFNGNRVKISTSQLTYYYGENIETQEGGQLIKAEEWISDKEALNKSKTKLYPKSGKFRRKTVDRMEALFNAAMDAFEYPNGEVTQPTRKHIVED